MRDYEIIKVKERQGFHIKTLIRKALKSGSEVTVLTIVSLKPIRWRGLPVDLITGLEAGLTRELQPKTKWNLRED